MTLSFTSIVLAVIAFALGWSAWHIRSRNSDTGRLQLGSTIVLKSIFTCLMLTALYYAGVEAGVQW